MGFDNECILNIQSLAGEYFCPVCRLLVYPNEALQSQCTHLYCKPCLTYIVSTTRACPYDGYLVTEADSKPLIESNEPLAETIGKIIVRCLYHRSGCTWQGPLSDCTTHCSECAFGNSPVVCNRCAVQIVHRQVQEHAQNCPGVQQPQGGQEVTATSTATVGDQTQIAAQAASQVQITTAQTAGQNVAQPASANSQAQVVAQAAGPTPEQWYQQQYQQYYQSYHGYDPYQQHYQPQNPYQQTPVPQYQQQFQGYVQAQPVSQPQLQPHIQSQSQPQLQAPPHFQAPVATQPQKDLASSQNPTVQSYPQAHPVHSHPQHPPIPQYQQSQLRMQDSQLQSQNQAVPQHPANAIAQQTQVQNHPQPQPQLQPHPQPLPNHPIQAQPQHSIHGVTGYQSYTQHQTFPQMQLGAQQNQLHVGPRAQSQHPAQIPGQFPEQQLVLRPSHSHSTIPDHQPPVVLPPGQVPNALPAQHSGVNPRAHQPGLSVPQRPVMQPIQRPIGQQFVQQQQPFVRPPMGQVQNQMNQQSLYAQQLLPLQPQLCLQGPTFPQQAHVYPQMQQNVVMPTNKLQNLVGKPVVPIHGAQSQPHLQSTAGMQVVPMQIGPTLQSANNPADNDQVQLSSEQQVSSRPAISGKQGDLTFEKSEADQESETDKPANDDIKRDGKVEEKSSPADASSMENPESHATENREPVIKHPVKEEVIRGTEDKKDVSSVDHKKFDHILPGDKKLESQLLDERSGKDKSGAVKQFQYQSAAADEFRGLPSHGVQAEGPFTDQGRNQAPPSHYGPSALQDRAVTPSLFPAQLPGDPSSQSGPLPHRRQPPNASNLQPLGFRQLHSTESGILGPDAAHFGSGPGHGGLQHRIEQQSVALQGPYIQVHVPPPHTGPPRISHGELTGGMPSGTLQSSAFDSQSGMMARAPMGAEILPNKRPGYMDGREPDLHFPGSLGRGFGLQSEMFKPFSEDHLNPLPLDRDRHIISRGKFEEDLKKFPRPSSLENEPLPRFGCDLSSSSTLNRGPPGFGIDSAPGPHDKRPYGLNNDPMLKVAVGPAPARFLPPYAGGGKFHPTDAGEIIVGRRKDSMGKSDSDRTHPDFLGPVPGYGRYHSDGLPARSPVREYPGMTSHGFRGLTDGGESQRFGDPIGRSFHESRFPILPNNVRRGEFEGPGSLRLAEHFVQDSFSGHSRRAEHLSSHNLHGHLRLGEPVGFGAFPGHRRMELAGPGNFPRPRLGEPGFRSSLLLQGEMEPFDSTRKRKPVSMGWCRICKQDCGSVEGLEMHSQTREHQRKAIDMVSIIKENAKKQKIVPNDRTTLDETSKSKNSGVEGRWNKH
ncbi:hypothetical protein HS088_TW07G00117 [Tripterygium wilfordii]|uniref:RING-type domain-containing protein n=1 Tax=Tripterygium wilfordii TaxID=458696 RepID=A0A7J7DE26_TRIWF|nr:mediator of RNA polymerase II transcription subunit 12-like [Tripterygium wilfordii]XP_038707058.1 mediator of RNA polymerase II transcription subunit 12-like [Tripterygium wilfordii]KAF5744544.1 hypothetical protein HS088_TW07G00117 [Tripterygium wilfordii]